MKKGLIWLIVIIFTISLAFSAIGCKAQAAATTAAAETTTTVAATTTTAAVETTAAAVEWKNLKTLPSLKIPTNVPKKKVAVIPLFFGHDAHKGMVMQIEQIFTEVGWDWDVFNPDTKIDAELKMIDDVISKGGYDYILLNPCDSGGIIGGIEKLNQANIPVFLFDRISYGGNVVWGTTSDSYQAGALLAQKIVDLIIQKNKDPKGVVCAMLNNPEVDTHALRIDGLHDVMSRYPNIKLYEAMVPAYDPASAVKIMQDLVSKHPEADALYSQCTFYANGYIQALKEIGRLYPVGDPKHLFYGSIDGDPYAHQQIRDGWQDVEVTHAISEWGGVSAWAMIMYAAGQKLPDPGFLLSAPGSFWDGSKVVMAACGPEATLKVTSVTKDNVDDPQFWGNQGKIINDYWATRTK